MDSVKHTFSWQRLIAAVFGAFIASLVWLGLYSEYFGSVGPYFGNVLLGFFGVVVGTLAFHRRHRFIGSLILFAGGVAIDLFFEGSDDKVYPLSVIWVALGGLLPVAFWYFRQPPNTALEPTADSAFSLAGSRRFATSQFGGGSAFGR